MSVLDQTNVGVLPPAINKFFQVTNGAPFSLLQQCFSEDAVVREQDQTFEGRDAIQAWLQSAQRKHSYSLAPVKAVHDSGNIRVFAKLTGDFEGGPVQVEYLFKLRADKIEELIT